MNETQLRNRIRRRGELVNIKGQTGHAWLNGNEILILVEYDTREAARRALKELKAECIFNQETEGMEEIFKEELLSRVTSEKWEFQGGIEVQHIPLQKLVIKKATEGECKEHNYPPQPVYMLILHPKTGRHISIYFVPNPRTARLLKFAKTNNEAPASSEDKAEWVYYCYICRCEVQEKDWRDHVESEQHLENQKTYNGTLLCNRYQKKESSRRG